MTRLKAFTLHFAISLTVVGIVSSIVFFLWYPGMYFRVVGTTDVLRVLIGVDLVLGPLLTLILFRPGKPGLRFDLTMIATIQLAALIYGVTVIYQERPYFTVFVVDRFEVIARRDIDFGQVRDEVLRNKPWTSPVYAVAQMPTDFSEREKLMEETLFEGKPDIDRRPEFWSPYAVASDAIRKRARKLTNLKAKGPDAAAAVEEALARHGEAGELLFVPIMGKKRPWSLVLDPESLRPLDLVDIDPWA